MSENLRPAIAVTMGDPAGVGPEVLVAAWSNARLHETCRLMAVGQPDVLRRAARLLELPLAVVEIDRPEDAAPARDALPCLACGGPPSLRIAPGEVTSEGGQAAFEAAVTAVDLALAGRVDGITTAPLSKAALWKAGHPYPGHTELFTELCGVTDTAMMLYLPPAADVRSPYGLGVVHCTLHVALREVFDLLSPELIAGRIRLAKAALQALQDRVLGGTSGLSTSDEIASSRLTRDLHADRPPRLAVCALNPHAGEGGLFGSEEREIIAPAIWQAQAAGFDVTGPLPADSVFSRAAGGEFDGVVAMYHDQGHIALKMLGMHRAVNVTLGLPIVRTSVAHGTAADRAWQGVADPRGMMTAIGVAAQLAARRLARSAGSA